MKTHTVVVHHTYQPSMSPFISTRALLLFKLNENIVNYINGTHHYHDLNIISRPRGQYPGVTARWLVFAFK